MVAFQTFRLAWRAGWGSGRQAFRPSGGGGGNPVIAGHRGWKRPARRRVGVGAAWGGWPQHVGLSPLVVPGRGPRGPVCGASPAMTLTRFSSGHTAPLNDDAEVTDDNPVQLRNPCNGSVVYILGTAHISPRSAEQTTELIRTVRPDTVVVELDARRAERLRREMERDTHDSGESFLTDLFQSFSSNRSGSLLAKLLEPMLRSWYRSFRVAGLIPGGEFMNAIREAEALGARVVYGDRNARETLDRIITELRSHFLEILLRPKQFQVPAEVAEFERNLREAIQRRGSVPGGTADVVDQLLNRPRVRQFNHFIGRYLPELMRPLLHERDAILAQSILNAPGERVVAIVGLGHMDGIERRLRREAQLVRATTQGEV